MTLTGRTPSEDPAVSNPPKVGKRKYTRRVKPQTICRVQSALQWRWHSESEGRRRVWNVGWGFDMFEVVSYDEFKDIEKFCTQFGISLTEADED